MAKGNIFLGDASGRVGSVVLSTRAGEMITRKYQANVKNPKTTGQMSQRARFANAVKFYKHATQHFFYFAYEDKKRTESDYNAFMRHNLVNDNVLILPKTKVDGTFPAVAKNWVMTAGSLNNAVVLSVPANNNDDFYFEILNPQSRERIAADGINDKVGTFSKKLIALGLGVQEGDILTSVLVTSDVTLNSDDNPSSYPNWTVKQIRIDSSSEDNLKDKLGVTILGTTNAYFYGFGEGSIQPSDSVAWGALILTRKTDDKLYCDNSVLTISDETFLQSCVNAETASLQTWNPSGTAILKGALSSTAVAYTSPTLGSSNSVEGTTLDGKSYYSIIMYGSNLPKLSASDFKVDKGGFTTLTISEVGSVSSSDKGSGYEINLEGSPASQSDAKVTYLGGSDIGGITWELLTTSSSSTVNP